MTHPPMADKLTLDRAAVTIITENTTLDRENEISSIQSLLKNGDSVNSEQLVNFSKVKFQLFKVVKTAAHLNISF